MPPQRLPTNLRWKEREGERQIIKATEKSVLKRSLPDLVIRFRLLIDLDVKCELTICISLFKSLKKEIEMYLFLLWRRNAKPKLGCDQVHQQEADIFVYSVDSRS